ncbi:MAG: 4-hydroxythreonine-4-phosphate dehydrogenase PdxA [Pseudomonadales bacterium]|nr:4-hydroxythreonine-4-phosphate dehydrogenase PdxA [Pseudomonadales bacterium]
MDNIRLAITLGEPAGIGPDLVLQLMLTQARIKHEWENASLIIIADPELLSRRAKTLGIDSPSFHIMLNKHDIKEGQVNVWSVPLCTRVEAGSLDPRNASYVIECLEQAVQFCEQDICQAMVTGPIQKSTINDAGIAFSGHTEWLATRTKTSKVVMMLASRNLRVALATTHLALKDVPGAIQNESLSKTISIIDSDLKKHFNMKHPRIHVCGLNPHAGESGYLGTEEIDIIIPVIEQARALGIDAIGPLPADTAFTPSNLANADIILAMYHDQGLSVLKYQGFGESTNITLGLPIIRTSVDHGTALDIAGTGKADLGSLQTALKIATDMSRHRINTVESTK